MYAFSDQLHTHAHGVICNVVNFHTFRAPVFATLRLVCISISWHVCHVSRKKFAPNKDNLLLPRRPRDEANVRASRWVPQLVSLAPRICLQIEKVKWLALPVTWRVLHKNPSSGKTSTQLFGAEFFNLYVTAVWEDGFFGEHSQLHCR